MDNIEHDGNFNSETNPPINNKETTIKRVRTSTMVKLGELADRIRKVLAIKQAVANGSYSVDSEKLAEAMLKKELK